MVQELTAGLFYFSSLLSSTDNLQNHSLLNFLISQLCDIQVWRHFLACLSSFPGLHSFSNSLELWKQCSCQCDIMKFVQKGNCSVQGLLIFLCNQLISIVTGSVVGAILIDFPSTLSIHSYAFGPLPNRMQAKVNQIQTKYPWCHAWCHGHVLYATNVPRCNSSMLPGCHRPRVPQCQGSAEPGCHGARVAARWPPWWWQGTTLTRCHTDRVPNWQGDTVPGCHSTTVPQCQGAKVPRCQGTMVHGCRGAIVPRYQGVCHSFTRVPQCQAKTVPWCHCARGLGATVPLCKAARVPQSQ